MNTLIINGNTLEGLFIDTSLSFNKPERRMETVEIPGRNGALILDEGVFSNVLISFPAYIRENFQATFNDLINYLGSLAGYQRIEISNDPEHFRLGRVILPTNPEAVRLNKDGFFELAFDCKPQRFLKSGETAVIMSASGSISNPTNFMARPLIRAYGTGSFSIAGVTVTITAAAGSYTDIDSEMQDCFYNTANRNAYVNFSGNDFPVLAPGENAFTLGAGITQLSITPRWWEL